MTRTWRFYLLSGLALVALIAACSAPSEESSKAAVTVAKSQVGGDVPGKTTPDPQTLTDGGALVGAAPGGSVPSGAGNSPATQAQAIGMMRSAPAVFVENRGQWPDPAPAFALISGGVNVGLASDGVRFQLFRREEGTGVTGDTVSRRRNPAEIGLPTSRGGQMEDQANGPVQRMHEFAVRFVGLRETVPVGRALSGQIFNYRRGAPEQWRENVPAWESVAYPGLYDGIDLVVMGGQGGIKYEFHVAPGADYRQIQIRYDGVDGLSLREDGSLEIRPAPDWPALTDGAPVIYQSKDPNGGQIDIPGRFSRVDSHTLAFEITGDIDHFLPLVIDPKVEWVKYLGGNYDDIGNDKTTQ
jgi:hypothetical protein